MIHLDEIILKEKDFQAIGENGRQVKQISACHSQGMYTVVALCRDNSMWMLGMGNGSWERLPEIPKKNDF